MKQVAAGTRLLSKYGITRSQWTAMYEQQGGLCAICGRTLSAELTTRVGSGIKTCVDHCHETGAVRGLLCDHCNKGLGSFRDKIDLLRSAVGYLESYE